MPDPSPGDTSGPLPALPAEPADLTGRTLGDYQVLRTAGELSLVRVTLFTGRKHQIRVHLSERGAAILGDTVYANKDAPQATRLMLMAYMTLTRTRTREQSSSKT